MDEIKGLVERLRDFAKGYYHHLAGVLAREAADALAAQEAEIARLREYNVNARDAVTKERLHSAELLNELASLRATKAERA